MIRIEHVAIALAAGMSALASAPAVHADETVMYEVTSSDIATANVEYQDLSGRQALEQVGLPWRMNATVVNPYSNAAEIRADWRPVAAAGRWVTVRVYYRGSLLCQNTIDVGNAACYGSTAHKT